MSKVHKMPGTNLPRTLRKLVATQFSPKFRDVVAIAEEPMPQPGDGEVLIKNRQVNLCKKVDVNCRSLRIRPSVCRFSY